MAKCEHLNPTGSVKDRAALWIVEDAEKNGTIKPGGTIVEGTSGNTGIALAMVASMKGYKCEICIPDYVSIEKQQNITMYGSKVHICPTVPFSNPNHYYHTSMRLQQSIPNSIYADQFNNKANFMAHLEGTGPEIWKQTNQEIDAFTCSSGTGGTISGCAKFFKKVNPDIKVFVIDHQKSGLFDHIKTGKIKSREMVQGHSYTFVDYTPGATIIEGIATERISGQLRKGVPNIDGAFIGTDKEAVEMAYFLKHYEGLFVGSSAALNIVGAVKTAQIMGPGHTIVTVLCDGGTRYQSKLYDEKYL